MNTTNFAQRLDECIRRYSNTHDMSRTEVIELISIKLSVDTRTVYAWVRGLQGTNVQRIKQLAALLGVSPTHLLSNESAADDPLLLKLQKLLSPDCHNSAHLRAILEHLYMVFSTSKK